MTPTTSSTELTEMAEGKALDDIPGELAAIERDKKLTRPVSEIPVTMQLIQNMSLLPSMPEHYRGKPQEILAATLMGREIGIGPVTSWNNIDLIEGTVSLRAKLMAALIERRGHIIIVEEQSDKRAALRCQRYHSQTNQLIDVGTIEYTIEDAERAGLLERKGKAWHQHPRAMLTNRALTLACRTVFADALMGFAYTAEEIGVSDEPDPIPEFLEIDELDAAQATVEVILDAEVVEV
jgi:hypothetical protein